jgi:hypothetical protein
MFHCASHPFIGYWFNIVQFIVADSSQKEADEAIVVLNNLKPIAAFYNSFYNIVALFV